MIICYVFISYVFLYKWLFLQICNLNYRNTWAKHFGTIWLREVRNEVPFLRDFQDHVPKSKHYRNDTGNEWHIHTSHGDLLRRRSKARFTKWFKLHGRDKHIICLNASGFVCFFPSLQWMTSSFFTYSIRKNNSFKVKLALLRKENTHNSKRWPRLTAILPQPQQGFNSVEHQLGWRRFLMPGSRSGDWGTVGVRLHFELGYGCKLIQDMLVWSMVW